MNNIPPTPHSSLLSAYDIGKKEGLKYIYIGNVPDIKHSSTFCPKCKRLLVERSNYETDIKDLDRKSGKCKKCGEEIYGTFN